MPFRRKTSSGSENEPACGGTPDLQSFPPLGSRPLGSEVTWGRRWGKWEGLPHHASASASWSQSFGGGEEGSSPEAWGGPHWLGPPPHQLSGDSRDSCAQVGRVIMFHSFH